MKRLFNLFLAVVMIFSFTCIQVYAANGTGGSGNIDGGGGSMGDATSHGSWNPGNEGVRVTVVRASDHAVVTTPFDLTNKTPSAGIYHFGKVSKIQYNNGTGLSPIQGGYSYKNPVQPMPRIISTNGRNNIEAIKKYFCSEYVVKFIAEETGMDYDTLISGEYKILLEPIAYYKFQGVMIATTATEAALYDEVVGGQLRYWMGSLTAKNLPLSMFLETPDLGYPAWSGPTNKNVSNSDIKSSLGLGIVRFEEQPEEPEISTYDYEYRTNTEVITAVEVSGGQSDPDDPVTVQFHIDGTTYTVSNVYYDEEWAAEDNKFRSITSFTASRASLRELRDYLADTLKYARIRAERQIKAGELPGGWFDPKDWDGWQKHMEGLIHRLDGVLALEGSTLELAHPPAPTVPELTM